jgi:multicomponent K+:H+ antiporter subunit E
MRWLLPHPVISAGLFAMWLLLSQSIAPGPALVGAVLAVLGGRTMALLEPSQARLRRPGLILRLAGHVAFDIARSNLAVALVILTGRKDRRSGFIRISLALRDPRALAALACILTATPGTAWIEFDTEQGELLLHVLDLIDEASWVQIVQQRYERPLLEIFP